MKNKMRIAATRLQPLTVRFATVELKVRFSENDINPDLEKN